MSTTDVMGGLDRLGDESRRFKSLLADEADVDIVLLTEFQIFAEYVERRARECEALLTEELIQEEGEA